VTREAGRHVSVARASPCVISTAFSEIHPQPGVAILAGAVGIWSLVGPASRRVEVYQQQEDIARDVVAAVVQKTDIDRA
jgi:hypothetical protein